MVGALLNGESSSPEVARLLHPEPLPDGTEPEERLILCGLSWQRYLDLDKALGDDRPGPRFYYLDGDLEIMTTSNEHERIKKWLGDLLAMYFDEIGLEVVPRGQATMRLALKAAGAEPDESWCLGQEKEFPDLVLEIALTSGGVQKLELYRRFHISEVWFWDREGLKIFTLRADDTGYEQVSRSRLLPKLDVALLERCARISSWRQARREFRAGLAEAV
ncbi:conserved hypothetical protein [Verrucomicrobia bacterium]|nr:conserved hypothetical protein [Verrucomicrobiota bacterium]